MMYVLFEKKIETIPVGDFYLCVGILGIVEIQDFEIIKQIVCVVSLRPIQSLC